MYSAELNAHKVYVSHRTMSYYLMHIMTNGNLDGVLAFTDEITFFLSGYTASFNR